MPHGVVVVRIHETDVTTWETLAKVCHVQTSDTTSWIELVDPATDITVTFFTSVIALDNEPEEAEEPAPALPAA
jgi:hypothetical protein